MKKLLFVLVIVNYASLSSQTYIPMIEDSMIVVNGYNGFDFTEPVVYKYLGDTVINATSYFKVYHCSSLEDSSYSINSNLTYYGAIREVNKKVFFLKKDSLVERKIYDFNLSINDTTQIFFSNRTHNTNVIVKLEKIDTARTFYGRKVYEHSHTTSVFYNHYYIVEGFGVIHYSSNEIENDYPTRKTCVIKKNNSSHNIPSDYSTCYWQLKNSFISLDEITTNEVEIFPNPTNNEITIKTNDLQLKSVSVYDLNGRLIKQMYGAGKTIHVHLQTLDSGIYLVKILTDKGIYARRIVKK